MPTSDRGPEPPAPPVRPRHRALRWVLRTVFVLLAMVVLVIPGAIAVLKTRWGQQLIRAQVEKQLAATFTGGATLGGVEGNPFGELRLHDLVINGPDRKPAISARSLTVEVGILPLLSHQARVLGVSADGLDIDLKRDADGELAIKHLTKPGPSSGWSVALPRVTIRNSHVQIDTGSELINLDGISLDAWARLPHGGPIDAGVAFTGTWREREAVKLAVDTVVHTDDKGVAVPYVTASAGDVQVIGNGVTIRFAAPPPAGQPARAPAIGGAIYVNAPAAAVAQLVPAVQLPADVELQVSARPLPGQTWTELAVSGTIDRSPVRFTGSADIDARHARGELATGALDLTKLTRGKVAGRASATVTFDARPGESSGLPTATATIRGWGEIAGVPRTALDIALDSAGERARATIKASGKGVDAELAATLRRSGERLAIEGATLHVATTDPARASGGKAPVHGALRADLKASGQLRPSPSLAVTGTLEGRGLRMQDLSVSTIRVVVDAKALPSRPYGHAHVQVVDLVRQNLQLGEITVDATDRADGKIAVAVRSRPVQNPWLVDADALVTPPGPGAGKVLVDLVSHHVRAGGGTDWTGKTGHLEIGREKIELRDLASASKAGSLSIAASYDRAGRGKGDLVANIDAKNLTLDNIEGDYRGRVDAHVAVARRGGAWQGDIALDGRGLSVDPTGKSGALDAHVTAGLHGRQLAIAVNAATPELGSAVLAIDAEAPAAVADPAAWKRLDRSAIRTASLTLRGIDLCRAAQLAGLGNDYNGKVNGDLQISATSASGRIEARDIAAPALRGLPVTAVLDLSQRSATELTPTVTLTSTGAGTLVAQADLAAPERMFDPVAWHQLGRNALRGATVRAEGIAIDPGLLDRLNIITELRGRATIALDLGAAARSVNAKVDITQLRGNVLALPIDVHLTTAIDDRASTATISVESSSNRLLELSTELPISLPTLLDRRGEPGALRSIPLTATVDLAAVDATKLLAVFGRTEVTGGTIDGKIELGGTLGAPTVTARLSGTKLTIPPGPRGKPVRTVDKLAITAGWDGKLARFDIAGTESEGGTLKLSGEVPPGDLRSGKVTIKAVKFDLVPLLVFAPGPAGGSSGELDADLRLNGLDLRTSQIAGELHLRNARIPATPEVGTLRQAKIDLVIADHEAKVAVDGKLGAGTATVNGTIALDGAAPNGGKATIKLRKISPIGSVEPQISADINATLSRDRNQWKAELVVDHGNVVVPSDRGEKLKPAGAPADMVFTNGQRITRRPLAHEAPTNPIFAVQIDLRSTNVTSQEFRGVIHGKLEIRADGQAVALYGGIDADRGDLDLFGRRYLVERAGVNFDGSTDPLLDVMISHDFPEVTTTTQVRGRLSKPELIMSADPGTYSQGQLLGFLLGGEPGGDPQSGSVQDQVAGAGESYVANQLGGYVKKALPINIDVLRYEAATSSSSAAVEVGSWINSAIFVAYRQHIEARPDENSGEGEIEYWFTHRVVLEGTSGNRGFSGVDLLWRRRY